MQRLGRSLSSQKFELLVTKVWNDIWKALEEKEWIFKKKKKREEEAV